MILVTGGAGYIGSVLIPQLIKRNYPVRVLDLLIFGSSPLKKYQNRIELVKGDIRNPPRQIFNDVKTVIHLAGLSNDPTANFDPQANYEINTQATISLAKLAKKNQVERFVFGSSCSVYDQGLQNRHILQSEDSTVNPTAPYSRSKRLAEIGILPLANNKFSVTVFRKGTVIGFSPRMRYDLVVNTMIKDAFMTGNIKILAAGKQWRPLITVNDAALGYLQVIKAPVKKINKEIFNLLSFNYRIIDVAKKVKRALSPFKKVTLDIETDLAETRSYKVSNQKMKQQLNFLPLETIENGTVDIAKQIKSGHIDDFTNPSYYNIQWMKQRYQKGKYL